VRILAIDIETSPNIAEVWTFNGAYVQPDQVREYSHMICFAAQWLGEPRRSTSFYSEWEDGREAMAAAAHELIGASDAVMTYNGDRFDSGKLNDEFRRFGLGPVAPYMRLDLIKTIKKEFALPSNSLANVLQQFGLSRKMPTGGHKLWRDCMDGDPRARARIERYNKQDVWSMIELYYAVRPWIVSHPSFAAFDGAEDACPRCGGRRLERRGFAYTAQAQRPRYRCRDCGGWCQGTRSVRLVHLREAA
jgi:hypothetical protein